MVILMTTLSLTTIVLAGPDWADEPDIIKFVPRQDDKGSLQVY